LVVSLGTRAAEKIRHPYPDSFGLKNYRAWFQGGLFDHAVAPKSHRASKAGWKIKPVPTNLCS